MLFVLFDRLKVGRSVLAKRTDDILGKRISLINVTTYLANVTLDKPTALSFEGLFENEINYYVDSILNDRDLSSIAEDGCTLMKILDAIYESAATGSEVKIK